MARGRGRPPAYSSVEEMQEAIDAYFDECDEKGDPYTMTGLAIGLGFMDRHSIGDYERKPEYTTTIKSARLRVENYLEKNLYNNNVTGTIFNLKNNFGWKDKHEQEISGPNGKPLEIRKTYETPEEAAKAYSELIKDD